MRKTKGEIILEIKNLHPDELTLNRMAAYMREFSTLLGAHDKLRFSAVRIGSTCIVAKPSSAGGISAIRKRVLAASKGDGPKEAIAAFDKLSSMASDDGTPAKILDGVFPLAFLRANRPISPALRIYDRGHVSGVLEGLLRDSRSGAVKAKLRPADGPQINCTVDKKMAPRIGEYFLCPVRVYGPAQWERNSDGQWSCVELQIEDVIKLNTAPLSEALENLRNIPIEWEDDPWDGFEDLDEAAGDL